MMVRKYINMRSRYFTTAFSSMTEMDPTDNAMRSSTVLAIDFNLINGESREGTYVRDRDRGTERGRGETCRLQEVVCESWEITQSPLLEQKDQFESVFSFQRQRKGGVLMSLLSLRRERTGERNEEEGQEGGEEGR
jgi:hypothetical protein